MSALKTCPQCGSEYELDVMFCPRDGSTLRAPAGSSLVGTIVADRYHILRKLGEGGMGQVYLAEHVKMGRKSAIKVMNPGMSSDTDAIGRFNREAANASRISQNNVAAIYDFGETPDGLIYLAMEYVDGEPLTALMEREGALTPARAADITRQVAAALDAAHDMGIVHRDLKPDNIMLARQRDGADLVKVVDFGIAKAQGGDGQKVTKTGLVVGTPEYMSPEQLAGDALDGRSDTYTLGLVAFHMLTGKLPFPSDTIQESMIMRLTDRPRTLAEMRPELTWPQPVQDTFDRVLQRKAEDRYQRSSQFATALTNAVRGLQGAPAGAAVSATAAVAQPLGGTLPPTRVRDGAVAGASPGGAPPATTAAPSSTSSAHRSRALLPLGAGGGLLVAAAAAWFFLGSHRAAPGGAADSTQARSQQVAANDTQPLSHVAAPASSSDTTRSAAADTGHSAGAPAHAGAGTSAQLASGTTTPPRHDAAAPRTMLVPPGPSAAVAHTASSGAPAGTRTSHAETGGAASVSAADAATARAQMDSAANLLVSDNPDAARAIRMLYAALRQLPTRDDSVTAEYHVGEALFLQAEQQSDDALRRKGCDVLRPLRGAAGSTFHSAIMSLFGDRKCQ
ncbi:MAG TPA: protein kinase [Gemmatimonadaceae bacterium]|nr:protein kinase [Gemmatimonadaceae bacterium]